jgi:DNA-binding CsgD family transcriptional regulator
VIYHFDGRTYGQVPNSGEARGNQLPGPQLITASSSQACGHHEPCRRYGSLAGLRDLWTGSTVNTVVVDHGRASEGVKVFGRVAELGQIEEVLERVDGGPSGLALEGMPGIGKSTLWREGVQLARARGLRVLATAPSEPDSGLAFSGLGDLFDEVPEAVLDELPAPQRRALDAALFVVDPDEAPANPQALPRAVLGVMRALAGAAPLVVAIDDEQWLDRASARALAFALCRLTDEPVGVVLARRPQTEGVLWPELARGFGGEGLAAMKVEPLDVISTGRLLAERLGRPIGRPLLKRIHETSGGNPLYALAISRELGRRRDGSPGGSELPIPATLVDAVAQRLERLDPRASDPLLVVSAASQPTLALLQSVLPEFVLGDLDSAERAGVIELEAGRARFTHPLLASTHYARAPVARRRALHRLLAEVLEDDEQRAYHLARAAEVPDREIAATIELASGVAARRGAPESAAELLERASELTPAVAATARSSRVISAAEMWWRAGDATRSRELLERLLPDLEAGPIRARALGVLAEVRTDDGAIAHALLQEALDNADGRHALRSGIASALAAHSANVAEFKAMVAYARMAVESAELAEDPGLLSRALGEEAVAAFFNGEGVDFDALRRGVELTDADSAAPLYSARGALAQILFWSDDHGAALPVYDDLLRLSRERGEVYDTGAVLFEMAVLEWYAGNRELAERHRSAAEELVRGQGEHDLDLWLMWGESLFAAGRGELEDARAAAIEAIGVAEEIGNPLIATLPTTVLASVELWLARPGAAHDVIGPVRESFLASGLGFIGSMTLGLWSLDIEALIAGDRPGEAQPVLEDLLRRASRSGNGNATGIAERCRGLLLAARGDIAGAIDAMDRALAEHARRSLAPEIARTLLERGSLLRRAKRKSAAKESLDRALAIFEQIGAPMWAGRARDQLSRVGLRRAAVSEGLTPAQERVAELVVAGLSNREIASALYMSPRSVESHLTKVYREIGVKSRSQLVAALAAANALGEQERRGLSHLNEVYE